jgi:hypothetical protein
MRSSFVKAAFTAASLFALSGCAANPLVGTWVAQQGSSGIMGSITLTLGGDGTASTLMRVTGGTVAGMNVTCTGAGVSNTGFRWTSTATTISVTGTAMCSGSVTCMVGGMSQEINCSSTMGMGMSSNMLESAMYALSNNNSTLTITPSTSGSSPLVFTRQM